MFLFDLPGPTFALFYLGLVVALNTVAYVLVAHARGVQESRARTDLQLDAYQVALLESRQRAVEAALTSLRQAKVLDWGTGWVAGTTPLSADAHPLERAVYQRAVENDSAYGLLHSPEVASQLAVLEQEMTDHGFLRKAGGGCLPITISALALPVGFLKILVGLSRMKPVGFLFLMTGLSLIPTFAFMARERLTPLGKRLWKGLRSQNEGLRATAYSTPENLSSRDAALAAAMFGLGFLGATEVINYFRPVYSSGSSSSWGSSSSSCGSSSSSCSSSSSSCSSSSSGCGSSCGGGGGCGGCGSS